MKNRKSVSTLALVAIVFAAWACGCPKNLNLNRSNNSNNQNNSHPNNSNTQIPANNSNQPPAYDDFITKFVVSGNSTGTPAKTTFGTKDMIYIVFGFANMPAGKGIKGKLVADQVEGVAAGSSLEHTRDTHQGQSITQFQFNFFPTPEWTPGSYHVELRLINMDGSEDIVKTQPISIQ